MGVRGRIGGGRPHVGHGVAAPGAPALGAGGVDAERRQAAHDAEVGRQEHVRIAEPAHHHVVGGPRADPRNVEQGRSRLVAVGPDVEGELADRRPRTELDERAPARGRHRQRRLVERGDRVRRREHVREHVVGDGEPVAGGRRDATEDRAGAAHRHLLADDGAHGGLERVAAAGHAAAGMGRHERRQRRIAAEQGVGGDRVGVEVEQATHATHGRSEVAPVLQLELGAHVRAPAGPGGAEHRHDAVAARQRQRAAVRGAVGVLDAGDRSGAQEGERRRQVVGLTHRQLDGHHPRPRRRWAAGDLAAPSAFGAQLAGRGGEHLADRVVELAHAAEPGGEGDGGERHRRRLDQDAGGAGALGAGDGDRSGAELVEHEPVEVALAVVEVAGEAGDAVAVDDAVGDEAHRPGDDVTAAVPVGRTG